MKANTPKSKDAGVSKYGRLVPVEIAGQTGYFNFSLAAAKDVLPIMSGLKDISGENLAEGAADVAKIAEAVSILLYQGSQYYQLMEQLAGGSPKALFTASAEDLSTLMTMQETMEMLSKIKEVMSVSGVRTVEVKPDQKNAPAAQSK